ncbi:hypothetical protein CYLTODRAFT_382729, partial [Cylindrobasidium torrendii FP15055 ss-10]
KPAPFFRRRSLCVALAVKDSPQYLDSAPKDLGLNTHIPHHVLAPILPQTHLHPSYLRLDGRIRSARHISYAHTCVHGIQAAPPRLVGGITD